MKIFTSDSALFCNRIVLNLILHQTPPESCLLLSIGPVENIKQIRKPQNNRQSSQSDRSPVRNRPASLPGGHRYSIQKASISPPRNSNANKAAGRKWNIAAWRESQNEAFYIFQFIPANTTYWSLFHKSIRYCVTIV